MSNVWMIVADAMSASNVAGMAVSAGAPVDALVFGDAEMAEAVAKLGVATVTRYDVQSTLAEAYAPAIAEKAATEAPAAVVLSDNAMARALAGAIAVRIGAAVATSVVSVNVADGQATVEQLVAEGEGVQVLKASAPVVCVIADGGPDAEEGAAVAGHVQTGGILVDGFGVGDVGNIVLRDRQHLAEDGIVIITMTLGHESGEVLAGPDIVSRGFVYVRESEDLMEEAQEVVDEALEECLDSHNADWNRIKTAIRDSLGDFLWRRTKRKPMILPIIMEVGD